MAERLAAAGATTAAAARSGAPAARPTDGVVVTAMRRRHLRAVTAIERQVNPHPWSYGLFAGELRMPSSRAWVVARERTRVVGFGGLMTVLEEGHITNVAVDPEFHRRHVATRMLLVLAAEAVARGVVDLTLEVRVSNRPAQQLYQRFGFAPGGVRRRYYQDNGEDALVMWAHDLTSSEAVDRRAAIEAALPVALRCEP
jgi:ribosomal-protein-alanine N-acetyltransferase